MIEQKCVLFAKNDFLLQIPSDLSMKFVAIFMARKRKNCAESGLHKYECYVHM